MVALAVHILALVWQGFSAFLRITVFFVSLRAVHQTQGVRWNRFLVAGDRTNALVHDTSITLRVAYPLSVQQSFASRHLPASYLHVLVSLTSRCDATRRSATEKRQPGNLVSNWKLCRDIIPFIIEIAFTGALYSARNALDIIYMYIAARFNGDHKLILFAFINPNEIHPKLFLPEHSTRFSANVAS